MNLSRPKGSSTSLVLKRKNPLNVEGHRPASVKETRWASRDELPPRGHRRLLCPNPLAGPPQRPHPPRHLAELPTGLSAGQHLTSPLSGRRPGNASPVSLSSLDPIRFPHDCELEAGGSRPAERRTPPRGEHHRRLPEGQQTGPVKPSFAGIYELEGSFT